MKIKLDENLSQLLKKSLVREGYDIETVADEGMIGCNDIAVGEAAKREGRILFTLDVEFADLRKYPPGQHPGIVLFRSHVSGIVTVNDFFLNFVKSTDLSELEGCVVIVDFKRVRVRKPD